MRRLHHSNRHAAGVGLIFLIAGTAFISNYRFDRFLTRMLQSEIPRFLEVGVPAKAFEPWNRSALPFPCVSEDSPDTQGIFYLKIPKASSSTSARITERIAAREAKREGMEEGKLCKIHDPMIHNSALVLNTCVRDKEKSFLWTMLRHPSDRAVSQFGMNLDMGEFNNTEITDEFFIDRMENQMARRDSPNFNVHFLASHHHQIEHLRIMEIIEEFNFIGIYERFVESLVVLSMIMGIDVTDVAFERINRACDNLIKHPSFLTEGMKNFLGSSRWKERERGDFMLYDAVNRSLDLTIEKLGKQKVDDLVEKFTKLLSIGDKEYFSNGCGRFGLHHKLQPFADLDELPRFDLLSPEDQEFVLSFKQS